MAAGSCAGVGEAGGFEWAQPERNTADETRSSVAVRRRGFALRHELIVAFLRMGLRRRSEEHTSELQSLMRISYAVFCLKKKKIQHKKFIMITYKLKSKLMCTLLLLILKNLHMFKITS